MVVDDSRMAAAMLRRPLARHGYQVRIASSGREALQLFQEFSPDLIVLDLRMPDMSGIEVTAHLRKLDTGRALPILLVTAEDSVEVRAKGLEAGADDFLAKRVTDVELVARVRSHLRIKVLHDELQATNALLERVLNRYVSADVTQEILANPEERLQLGGESKVISVLVADVRGFTRFSEHREAAEVIGMLNTVFQRLGPLVLKFDGTLDKYLGDALMAFFGAPHSTGQDAENAVRSALAMREAFLELQQTHPVTSDLGLGIAVCTGEAVVGNVGSDRMMDYTVIGDTVNCTHRLQGFAGPGELLVDTRTREALGERMEVGEVRPLQLKGRAQPLDAFPVLSLAPSAAPA